VDLGGDTAKAIDDLRYKFNLLNENVNDVKNDTTSLNNRTTALEKHEQIQGGRLRTKFEQVDKDIKGIISTAVQTGKIAGEALKTATEALRWAKEKYCGSWKKCLKLLAEKADLIPKSDSDSNKTEK
jgi:hypothetical protein